MLDAIVLAAILYGLWRFTIRYVVVAVEREDYVTPETRAKWAGD